jgi:HB1, ASXL, restriction endonuclease HTH domain
VTVLSAAGRPLTANEIMAEALARGLLQPTGKTPLASMTARLHTHVRDAEHPRIVRVFEQGPRRVVRGSVRWTLALPAEGRTS